MKIKRLLLTLLILSVLSISAGKLQDTHHACEMNHDAEMTMTQTDHCATSQQQPKSKHTDCQTDCHCPHLSASAAILIMETQLNTAALNSGKQYKTPINNYKSIDITPISPPPKKYA